MVLRGLRGLGIEFFLSHSLIFFLFAEATKELWTVWKEIEILLNSIFIFGVYDYFVMKRFPEPVEIALVTVGSVTGISGIISANCESYVSSIGGLRVHHVCLCSVGIFNLRSYGWVALRVARPDALAYTCAPSGSREKKEPSVLGEVGKDSEE